MTLVVRGDVNEIKIVQSIFPVVRNQEELNRIVNHFCLERNMTLISSSFTNWPASPALNEFQCEVCTQTCLQQTIDFENLSITESFCSNFCRHRFADNKLQE